MKEIIRLPRKYNILIYSVFGVIFLITTIYFITNTIGYKNELNELRKKELNGLIIESRKETRGIFSIVIRDNISRTDIQCSLQGSWFFIDNKISIGDSISKKANDNILVFYKLKNGVFVKCCEKEI